MKTRTATLRVDLYRLIKHKGYKSVTEFADEIGISPSAMSLIINDKSGGSRATRAVIARKLGKRPQDIWDGA